MGSIQGKLGLSTDYHGKQLSTGNYSAQNTYNDSVDREAHSKEFLSTFCLYSLLENCVDCLDPICIQKKTTARKEKQFIISEYRLLQEL